MFQFSQGSHQIFCVCNPINVWNGLCRNATYYIVLTDTTSNSTIMGGMSPVFLLFLLLTRAQETNPLSL